MCGKIFDCNGLVLVMSLLVKVIWVVFEDVFNNVFGEDMKKFVKLFGMSDKEFLGKLGEDKGFVYFKCQVLFEVVDQIVVLKIEGIYQMCEYKCFYLEGEVMVYIVGFINVEDKGQEGMELVCEFDFVGVVGQCQVIKDWLGCVVEDVGVFKVLCDGYD